MIVIWQLYLLFSWPMKMGWALPFAIDIPDEILVITEDRAPVCGNCVLNNKESIIDETTITIRVVKGLVAVLPCTVDPLYTEQFSDQYKVVWVNPLETIISLQDRRILNDDRLSIERNFLRDWNLHIRNVSLSDAGIYKCQINTNPVGTKKVILVVQEPPRIIDHTYPTDVEKPEGEMIQLSCNATGVPAPEVTWYRIYKKGNMARERVGDTGDALIIHNISKSCADIYECEAENGVHPSASQQFRVTVLYPPTVTLHNRRLSQQVGKDTALECYVSASPHGAAGWKHNGKTIINGQNHELFVYESQSDSDTLILSVRILRIESDDFGAYTCEATNSLGTGNATMMLNELSTTTISTTSTMSAYRTSHTKVDFKSKDVEGSRYIESGTKLKENQGKSLGSFSQHVSSENVHAKGTSRKDVVASKNSSDHLHWTLLSALTFILYICV